MQCKKMETFPYSDESTIKTRNTFNLWKSRYRGSVITSTGKLLSDNKKTFSLFLVREGFLCYLKRSNKRSQKFFSSSSSGACFSSSSFLILFFDDKLYGTYLFILGGNKRNGFEIRFIILFYHLIDFRVHLTR